jgi:hypothetical protein
LVGGVAAEVPLKTIIGTVQSGRRHYTLLESFELGIVVFGPFVSITYEVLANHLMQVSREHGEVGNVGLKVKGHAEELLHTFGVFGHRDLVDIITSLLSKAVAIIFNLVTKEYPLRIDRKL